VRETGPPVTSLPLRMFKAMRHVRHPAANCSKAQRAAFERIAINDCGPFHPATINALLRKGLIWEAPARLIGRDKLGPIFRAEYAVPPAIHYQWCAWCAQNGEV
jgi:hypothetical protein